MLRPFKNVLKWLGEINVESDSQPDPGSLIVRKEIKTVMEICNKYAIWKTGCYSQAITGKLLLKRYKLPSTIYIGFYKDSGSNYKGHAWIRSYDLILTGEKDKDMFQIQSFFS